MAPATQMVSAKKKKKKKKDKVKASDNGRNLRLEWVDPRTLSPNPKNWRRHPKTQVESVEGVIKDVGWAGTLLFNEATGRLIDGHLRRNLGFKEVPVLMGSWTEEQEAEILATLDPTAELALMNEKALAVVMAQSKAKSPAVKRLYDAMLKENEGLQREMESLLDQQLSDLEGMDDLDLDEGDDLTPISETPNIFFREDAVFSSTNKWGLPDLKEDMLSEIIPTEVFGGESIEQIGDPSRWLFMYGKAKFTPEMVQGGVLGFYVEDENFNVVWQEAVATVEKLYRLNWGGIIAPDFSLWADDPLVVQLWNVYRARWVSRFWQEAGIKVIPNMGWSDKRSYDFCFDGIPKKCPVICCQCRSLGRAKEEKKQGQKSWLRGFIEGCKTLEPANILIYGGIEHRAWIEKGLPKKGLPKIYWLDSWMAKRRAANFKIGD